MTHTLESIIKTLGKEAQVSGGAVTVYRGGKHISITKYEDGVFQVTPEGLELLGNYLEDGTEVYQAPKRSGKPNKAAVPDMVVVQD